MVVGSCAAYTALKYNLVFNFYVTRLYSLKIPVTMRNLKCKAEVGILKTLLLVILFVIQVVN